MNRNLVLVLILIFSFSAFAQRVNFDQRLEDREDLERRFGTENEFLHCPDNSFFPIPKSEQRIYSETEIKSLNAIIPDFRVNELAGPSGANQYSSSIVVDNNGNYTIVWSDCRNVDSDIYAQRYLNDGTPIGTNFKVNDDESGTYQSNPSIAADSSGNFIITWKDKRNGGFDIYAQRYLNDGTPIGINLKVNDDEGSTEQGSPSIAAYGSGNFIITWKDYRNGRNDIYVQLYSNDGTPTGTNFIVTDEDSHVGVYDIAIAADNSGNFIITWSDFRNHSYDIYAQQYSSDGTPLGSSFRVNDDQRNAIQCSSGIAANGNGNFIIAWTDYRLDNYDIYAQLYSSDGTVIGTNLKINDDEGSTKQNSPSIAVDGNENFIVTWRDKRDDNYDIYAQRFSGDGNPVGANFKVNDDVGSANQTSPSIAADSSGNFIITFDDYRNRDHDIYAQRFSSDGNPAGANFKANDDVGSANQYNPSIAVDGSGNFIITWIDKRNGNYDIYTQQYSGNGTLIGTNFKVNDDEGSTGPYPTPIAADGIGNFVITWQDYRNGDSDIYSQRYLNDGTPVGTNFKVNDDEGSAGQVYISLAADNSGNFIITWMDGRNGHYDIYAQRYLNDGTPIGINFKVNDDEESAYQFGPFIATDNSGNFIITWADFRYGNSDIYAQRYSSVGAPAGINFKINDDEGSTFQSHPSIVIDSGGDFFITWSDKRNGNSDIYAQQYSGDGTLIGSNFKVNDDEGGDSQSKPSIATESSGNFIITWEDDRNRDPDIYAQRYSNDGSQVGDNFRVTNTGHRLQLSSDVKLWNNKIYNTWADNRTSGTGYDIWANVLDWDNPIGIEDNEPQQLTKEFNLRQNYPNPFNPATTIQYNLPKSSFVELTIYNLTGQKIKTLVNFMQTAGMQSTVWNGKDINGKDVPSGIYIYTLKTNEMLESKKMLLIR